MSLWEEGGAQKFNSDPRLRIYFYSNHQEPHPIPYIWSQKSVLIYKLIMYFYTGKKSDSFVI